MFALTEGEISKSIKPTKRRLEKDEMAPRAVKKRKTASDSIHYTRSQTLNSRCSRCKVPQPEALIPGYCSGCQKAQLVKLDGQGHRKRSSPANRIGFEGAFDDDIEKMVNKKVYSEIRTLLAQSA
ncbi:hypothetical protein JCM16303_005335 [Sporobolomyces ruberrimus]